MGDYLLVHAEEQQQQQQLQAQPHALQQQQPAQEQVAAERGEKLLDSLLCALPEVPAWMRSAIHQMEQTGRFVLDGEKTHCKQESLHPVFWQLFKVGGASASFE